MRHQVGALPFGRAAGLRVLLVTSRRTRRWIVPKGWPMPGRADHEAAAVEAWEEAGIHGAIGTEPVGAYVYRKRRADGASVPCRVTVYPLAVESLAECWPEGRARTRRWWPVETAARLVEEPGLAALIRGLAAGD